MLRRAALAGVAALVFVLGVACLVTPPRPTPEAPFSAEDRPPSPAAGARPSGLPERVLVIGAVTGRVNLRAEPGIAGAILKGLVDGTELEVIGPDSAVEGRAWRNVRDPSDGIEGWVSAEFLVPVPGPSVPTRTGAGSRWRRRSTGSDDPVPAAGDDPAVVASRACAPAPARRLSSC